MSGSRIETVKSMLHIIVPYLKDIDYTTDIQCFNTDNKIPINGGLFIDISESN